MQPLPLLAAYEARTRPLFNLRILVYSVIYVSSLSSYTAHALFSTTGCCFTILFLRNGMVLLSGLLSFKRGSLVMAGRAICVSPHRWRGVLLLLTSWGRGSGTAGAMYPLVQTLPGSYYPPSLTPHGGARPFHQRFSLRN